MKKLFLIFFIIFSGLPQVYSQGLHVHWTKFIGPDSCCMGINAAIRTKDNGIIFTGNASALNYNISTGSGDIPPSLYGGVIVGKLDSAGNLLWIKTYGGKEGFGICQTPDGGYGIGAFSGSTAVPYGLVTGYKQKG